MYSPAFRRCLEEVDVAGVRRLWAHVSPHLPQPTSDAEALVILHRARTAANSIAFKLRAYSHRWLGDNGWPSGLPDHLRPKAERIYPRIVPGVGVAVKAISEHNKPAARIIQRAMSDAVLEADADGRLEDVEFVRKRMTEARKIATDKLYG